MLISDYLDAKRLSLNEITSLFSYFVSRNAAKYVVAEHQQEKMLRILRLKKVYQHATSNMEEDNDDAETDGDAQAGSGEYQEVLRIRSHDA